MSRIQILDGGLGTSLEDQYGVTFDHSKPLWSTHFIIESQDTLVSCQRDFAEAGVDVLLTATYQTSIEGFARTKTHEFLNGIPKPAVGSYLRDAVSIAEKAKIRESTKLALSLGPYGACMVPGQEYSGNYDEGHDSEQSLYRWHLERLRLFTEVEGLTNRLQMVALETIPRLDEIRAVRRAILTVGITLPFWISCVFPRDDNALPDGSTMCQVIRAMLEPMTDGAIPWGIGINCTKLHKLPSLIREMESTVGNMASGSQHHLTPSLVLYPDGTNGEVYNTTTKKWEIPNEYNTSLQNKTSWATQLANIAQDSLERGIFTTFLIGGCCKASAMDIKALREAVDDLSHSISQ